MPHDCTGKQVQAGDIVTFRARVTHVYETPYHCNVSLEGLDGADDERTKSTCSVNSQAVRVETSAADTPATQPVTEPEASEETTPA